MGEKTKIQWCDHTFNPWRGCAKVAAGCQNCYAERQAKRNPAVFGTWGPDGERVLPSDAYWRQPFAWDRAAARDGVRRRVFCGSMMDVFELRVDLEAPRARLLRLIGDTPYLDWLLLTKRPENYIRATHLGYQDSLPPNLWIGTTVEDRASLWRLDHLVKIPTAVRFVSAEPLLQEVDFGFRNWADDPKYRIHWCIVGGESGPKARPFDLAWARLIRDDCKAAGVAFFFKQVGARPFDSFYRGGVTDQRLYLRDSHGGDPDEWPEEFRVRQFPTLNGVLTP